MKRALLALWLSAASACAGTETGNPSFEGELEYNTYTSQPASVALTVDEPDDDVGTTLVDAAWLVLGDVRFIAGAECDPDADGPVHADGIGVGNHARGEAARTPLTIEAGRYCGVRFPLERTAVAGAAPDGLRDHSVLIEGVATDGRRFELRSRLETDVFLRAKDARGFALDPDNARVLIGFDVAVWLGDLEFASASAGDDDVILIDEQHNTDLLDQFEANLRAGTALYSDADGDGEVDADNAKIADGAR